MPLSQYELRSMAAAASTIPERLGDHILPNGEYRNNKEIQASLYAWCQASARGNWQNFAQRLAWDGLDLAGAQHLLSPGVWSGQVPLPAWTTTLREALHLLERLPGKSTCTEEEQWPFLDTQKPLPFEALLAPFVSLARQRFFEQAGTTASLLAEGTHLTLQRHLLHVLTSLSVPTLYATFAQRQAADSSERSDDLERYQHFLRQMYQGGMAALLRTYSVLARLLAATCDLWVEANVEFMQRLAADWSNLEQMFGSGVPLGQVTEIEPALSDMHAGRRCVMALTFAAGGKIIYKPRSVDMEEAYYGLLSWCNTHGAVPALKVLAILSRSTYGWVEYVAQAPCQDGEALRRYYQRAGMQLCLVYLLGGMNCCYDRLIAHGEQPVLVDASSLLQPYFRLDPQQRYNEDWEQESYSVLHTGLLTGWQRSPTASREARTHAADISGFSISQRLNGSTQDAGLALSSLLKYGSLKPRGLLNVVSLTDECGRLQDAHLCHDLSTGFRCMYQLLLQQRAVLLAAEGPLQTLKTRSVPLAFRDRLTYDKFLPDSLAPQALQDAVMRSMLLEPLGRDNVPVEGFMPGDRSHWWPVFAAERQALLQGDIPRFSVRADGDGIVIASDQEVPLCLCRPGFDLLLRRLRKLSNEDMHLQLLLLQEALRLRTPPATVSRKPVKSSRAGSEQLDGHVLMTQALSIADELARRAIKTGRNSVVWVNPGFPLRSRHYQLHPMRYGFADGISGIAFFLAAVAKSTGISRYRRLVYAALQPLRRLLREDGKQLICEMGVGAATGLGSVVYALTHISRFLDEPAWLADARNAARLITPECIADDRLLDVFMGTAGAILGLLALYEVSAEQESLEQAIKCGQHLLNARTPSKAACRAWPTLGGKHMTGFAHGTAGIVYALLRLYAMSGDVDFLEAAREGLLYEERAFVPTVDNWVKEVGGEKEQFRVSWCHGAPGMGLARIGGLPILDSVSVRRDIEASLRTTQQVGFAGLDHLCCGTSGRADILLTAAYRLERPELADAARRSVEQVLTRAEQTGAFFLHNTLPRCLSYPQLFQGTSGIGYTLLRLAQPDTLPSVLLWE